MTQTKKPREARRGKGRPARDQPGVGRDAVITATGELLKKRSPDSITRAELAREAGVDPGLVRYYFGDMSSLLTEGMIHVFTALQSRRAGTGPEAPLREQLRSRIGSLVEVLATHPHLHQLLMSPVLHVEPGKAEEVEALRREYTLATLETLRSMLVRAQDSGESIETDIRMFYVVMVGMAEFSVRCFQYFELLSVNQGTQAETLSRFADYVVDLLIDGLRPRA